METLASIKYLLISIFSFSYLAIIFEHVTKISKTAIALFAAIVLWSIYIVATPESIHQDVGHFGEYVYDTAQVVFFLLAAMAIVELVDSHQGFYWITRYIKTRSKPKLFIIISFVAFFLSSILDNLTTTILMITLLKKLVPQKQDRLLASCMVVIAANSGGAWTPIGDVTTTMLWIDGKISTLHTIKTLVIPSLLSMVVPLLLLLPKLKGKLESSTQQIQKPEPGSLLALILGVTGLVMIPVFKSITGLPPFMGATLALAVLWIVTDLFHGSKEGRTHLKIPVILAKLDMSSVLFFLGILLSVGLLQEATILDQLAGFLDKHISRNSIALPGIFGVMSAVIDNVPLVAASIGMYPQIAQDAAFWQQMAYSAGVGGSMLIIGSASGIALMGMENISFIEFLKKISFPALCGFLAGLGYLALIS
jgi:Na+/H+ antiporter NhaD/arsenite permease-like protein